MYIHIHTHILTYIYIYIVEFGGVGTPQTGNATALGERATKWFTSLDGSKFRGIFVAGFGLGPGLCWPGPSKTNDFERILG